MTTKKLVYPNNNYSSSGGDSDYIDSMPDYKKAYNILMDYFDELPDDIKEEVHQRLDDEANC